MPLNNVENLRARPDEEEEQSSSLLVTPLSQQHIFNSLVFYIADWLTKWFWVTYMLKCLPAGSCYSEYETTIIRMTKINFYTMVIIHPFWNNILTMTSAFGTTFVAIYWMLPERNQYVIGVRRIYFVFLEKFMLWIGRFAPWNVVLYIRPWQLIFI